MSKHVRLKSSELRRFVEIATAIRKRRKITYRALARKVGRNYAQVARVLNGRVRPSIDTVQLILEKGFGMSVVEFFSASHPMGKIVGANLKRLREAMDIDVTELARLTGVSQATISEIEQGLFLPGYELLSYLSKALRAGIYEFFLGDKERQMLAMRRTRRVDPEVNRVHKLVDVIYAKDGDVWKALRIIVIGLSKQL